MKVTGRSASRAPWRRSLAALVTLTFLVPAGAAMAATGAGRWSASGPPGTLTPVGYGAADNPAVAAPAATPSPSRRTGIWRPRPGTTWQWQIVGPVSEPFTDVVAYDVDLTDAVPRDMVVNVPGIGSARWPKGMNAGIVDRLHAAGKIVICYVATGAWESYEPDAKLFPGAPGATTAGASVIGKGSGWSGEHWLDIRGGQRARFAPIIWARFGLAQSIGCDGVHADQNNVHPNNPNVGITLGDEVSWYHDIASQAHARGLSVGMANGLEVLEPSFVTEFDWALNEECLYYNECQRLAPFIKAGKAVFHIEYSEDWATRGESGDPVTLAQSSAVCPKTKPLSFSTLIRYRMPDNLYVAC